MIIKLERESHFQRCLFSTTRNVSQVRAARAARLV